MPFFSAKKNRHKLVKLIKIILLLNETDEEDGWNVGCLSLANGIRKSADKGSIAIKTVFCLIMRLSTLANQRVLLEAAPAMAFR